MQQVHPTFPSKLQLAVKLSAAILEDLPGVLPELLRRPEITPGRVLRAFHLPLLLSFPVGILFSPFTYWLGWSGMKYILILSLLVVSGALVLAVVTDRIAEADGPRVIESPGRPLPKNIALFMHLPLATLGLLFFLHPALGLLGLILAEPYCLYLSIEALSAVKGVPRIRAILYVLHAVLFFLIPMLVLAFLFASYRTFVIFAG